MVERTIGLHDNTYNAAPKQYIDGWGVVDVWCESFFNILQSTNDAFCEWYGYVLPTTLRPSKAAHSSSVNLMEKSMILS